MTRLRQEFTRWLEGLDQHEPLDHTGMRCPLEVYIDCSPFDHEGYVDGSDRAWIDMFTFNADGHDWRKITPVKALDILKGVPT